MREYEIVDTNAENIGGCSFCGRKNPNNEGYRRKSEWLKKRYPEGLRLKVLRSREFGDIGTIEYVPGNHAWKPVEAEGYLVIHCLMVPVRSAKASRELPTPYGMFSIIYDGNLIVDRPVSGTRFASIMSKALGSPLTGAAAVSRMRLVRQTMHHTMDRTAHPPGGGCCT